MVFLITEQLWNYDQPPELIAEKKLKKNGSMECLGE
jgi:hypothetical protein